MGNFAQDALGANRGSVVWLVMREVLMLSTVGVAIGGAGANAATPLVQKELFGIQPTDALTLALSFPPAAPPRSTPCMPSVGSEGKRHRTARRPAAMASLPFESSSDFGRVYTVFDPNQSPAGVPVL